MNMKTLGLTFLALISACVSEITFTDNGYNDVIVSISPDVPSTNALSIIDELQEWITEGSDLLFSSTGKLAYIRSVKIFIPESWANIPDVVPSTDVVYEDGIIRVESENPCYGEVPYTVQTGGCGERGDKIMVTPDYLINLEGVSTSYYGPPENIFVHEWAKLRYGVFEEYGFPGDDAYPMFYYNSKSELEPNFCTDVDLQGHGEDFVSGGSCTIDSETGLPDENCIFVPDGTNDNVESSIMATPFLSSTNQFCREGENFYHNRNIPTKQNALCSGRSTWSVIVSNDDFVGVIPSNLEEAPDPTFTIIQPQQGQFVMVLDISGSMDDYSRLDRLKQSTMRWVRYDIRDGSYLGVTSFSEETYEDQPMTEINDQSREEIIDKIDALVTDGPTCLGAGIRQGLQTLSATSSSGGIMIFVTDGEFNCKNGDDDTDIDDAELLQEIIDSKVRIVTIAFGDEADPKLENLATISDGKTFFVPDGTGIEDLNDALQGTLTYQPSVASGDMDFVLFKAHYGNFRNDDGSQSEDFVIDATLGRDVTFQMDYNITGNDIKEVRITGPSGTQIFPFQEDRNDPVDVFVIDLGNMEAGIYSFTIVTNAMVIYADVLIISKTKDSQTLPFTTNCWASSGSEDVDPNQSPVAVLAEVKQGNMPVMNARVQARIEKEGQPTPLVLDLLDNGSGADQVANDGLYSRYFTSYYDETGRYLIKCQVTATDATEVNGGFLVSRKRSQTTPRGYPIGSALPPPCCGSTTLRKDSVRIPTGNFTREASGGSFKVIAVVNNNEDIYSPSRVTDFAVNNDFSLSNVLKLTFTSPGDDFDQGLVQSYDIRFSVNTSDSLFNSFDECEKIEEDLAVDGSNFVPVQGGTRKEILIQMSSEHVNSVLFFAMKSTDEAGNVADMSNVVRIGFAVKAPKEPSGSSAKSPNLFHIFAVLVVIKHFLL